MDGSRRIRRVAVPLLLVIRLSADAVIDGFYVLLTSALAQAKGERLLYEDPLASAEADIVIAGSALCLFFAALRATTEPSSVPIPGTAVLPGDNGQPTKTVSPTTCPELFLPFMTTVPNIQALIPDHQRDLARIDSSCATARRCKTNLAPEIAGIAADLRAVAVEIGQRQSLQERHSLSHDLQAAIDAGELSPAAAFVPPPSYERRPEPLLAIPPFPMNAVPTAPPPETSPTLLSPTHLLAPRRGGIPSRIASGSNSPAHRRVPLASWTGSASQPASPNLLPASHPPIVFVRERLYSAIVDVLARTSRLRAMLVHDRVRVCFASVGLAILQVATTCASPQGAVRGVLGRELTLAMCPPHCRLLMRELAQIGRDARIAEDEDTERAMYLVKRGEDERVGTPRVERVRKVLELGVGFEDARPSSAVQFANHIDDLALRMTMLTEFRQRQDTIFEVLA
ncbi:hypothetical protein AURDEDRAFT_140602 [Auricularia subglabra TFB-10046 SS5]|uniref:Uncharacterized protein n=1 Tax=Auricularia subglabra (strain TFB-10046 / SS5) TaxID=717982 RepID=J0WNT6_AURST|nr:hypothetical protein AURDEDRAFT_140602 [Auricularia subglabra TFB-10046 SS5]